MSPLQHHPCIERLEQRRLLASTLVADELVITGTAGNDFIWIEMDMDRGMLVVTDETGVSEYEVSTISNIRVFGYAGNDYLYAAPDVPVSLLIDGGEGNDRIYGGAGADYLLGGAGDDTLVGADGNDLLDGGDGNDVVSGNNGDDSMFGGAGADSLYGGSGADYLDGGDDFDALRGDFGPDQFAANSLAGEILDLTDEDTLLGGDSRPFKGFNSHAEWLAALQADAEDGGVRNGQSEDDDVLLTASNGRGK